MESSVRIHPGSAWLRCLSSPWAAAWVLLLFWALLIGSTWNKSLTGDELVPPVAGYAYWKFGDFRLDPENGNLPQRLAALPLLGFPFVPENSPAWREPAQWALGDAWFHEILRDRVPLVLRLGRAASALLAVALAALVWHCSRWLFGPVGGMISLLVCVLNPTVLANGALMTSDLASALFFLAATWAWWRLIQEVTPGRLLWSALAASGLLVSKMSAGLLIPIAMVLALVRAGERRPLEIVVGRWRRELHAVRRKAALLAGVGFFQALIAYGVLWGFYNFRYEAFAPDRPSQEGSAALWRGVLENTSLPELVEGLGLQGETLKKARDVITTPAIPVYGWSATADQALEELRQTVLSPAEFATLQARRAQPPASWVKTSVLFLAEHRIFPEAYLLGTLNAWRFAQIRPAFLDGEHYLVGKKRFFPYTFAVKTPLALAGLLVLAGLAAGRWWRDRKTPVGVDRWPYHLLPLAGVFIGYWLVALGTALNIGHRHILPVYPPLFVLCGAAGMWLVARRPLSAGGYAVVALLLVHVGEIAYRFPHYIAYFNGLISPRTAYRHFIDSTLDWGQDLPGVKSYVDAHPAGAPFYLSYFGNADPRTYQLAGVNYLPSTPGRFIQHQIPIAFHPLNPPVAGGVPDRPALREMFPDHEQVGTIAREGQPHAVLVRRRETWPLRAGTYLISATSLQTPYRAGEERFYQQLRGAVDVFFQPESTPGAAELRQKFSLEQWQGILGAFEGLRFARLSAYLRRHRPNDTIGFSILVYRVSADDLDRALHGPAPLETVDTGKMLGGGR